MNVLFFATSIILVPTSLALSSSTTIKTPIVICPGFGNDVIDYIEPLKQSREVGLTSVLERRGFESVNIVNVKRLDWVLVANGFLDKNFYSNSVLPTGKSYQWYIRRLKETVNEAYEKSGGQKVLLLGHSAGGWLCRASMGDGLWEDNVRASDRICGLVTIGAIHYPPEDNSKCVTRGILTFLDQNYPGAFLESEGIKYVSVGSDAITGSQSKDVSTAADKLYATRGEGSSSRVAFTSYEAVCGKGDVTGDGVVPLEWSLLDNTKKITLKDVFHSINVAGTTTPTDRWYGSENVIDTWLPQALEEVGVLPKKGFFAELELFKNKLFQ